ncbi:hypothetical protein BGW36DRAFT_430607 [Talaromyces proteolyticus]|uniref:Uncharacterized protein n=1 Tax=Talaromyces proteolyticus TaxID=1131652 RepID=A0AAD4KLA6_9EURO|nr:uncharacterized protein BGW36DRAFT_430607 [Talaromyces proteolyticus]KAH8692862.1 hypothetical protein BGW36DRAFT_430607 [Talaromyces proteolyticus]
MGYHIHPDIAARLLPNARTADIGTGTGRNSSNLEIFFLDARQPIIPELEGTYDLVHVRLLAMGLLQSDWRPVVSNLTCLLKPGRALQWEECNFLTATHQGTNPATTFEAVRTIENLLLDAFSKHFVWAGVLF